MKGLKPIELALPLAAKEAAVGGFAEITPGHLLMALCRIGELGPGANEGGAELRKEFERLGVEPRRFRRRLRALLGSGGAPAGKRICTGCAQAAAG